MSEEKTLVRLQKRIADSGLCSRRKAEEWIAEGRVEVNGQTVTEMGVKVSSEDEVKVDGKALPETKKTTIAFYKPAGYLTSKSDPHHYETIMDLIPGNLQHLDPAGRLDRDSEGLLILSSDGALVQQLTHPKYEHKKTYEVLVHGQVKEESLKAMREGTFKLGDYILNPMKLQIMRHLENGPQTHNEGPQTWLEITLTEGRKRQIRRMMDQIGHPVLYLCRMAVGSLSLYEEPLRSLQKGAWMELNNEHIQSALN